MNYTNCTVLSNCLDLEKHKLNLHGKKKCITFFKDLINQVFQKLQFFHDMLECKLCLFFIKQKMHFVKVSQKFRAPRALIDLIRVW